MKDLIGLKFGRLTVLKLDHTEQLYCHKTIKNGLNYFYLCICDCGNEIIVSKKHLLSGITKSCGCLQKEKAKYHIVSISTKHNLSKSRIYRIYHSMNNRCLNSNCKYYYRYGARGVSICQSWLDDFMNFYNWAMSNGYKDNLSIDRIDNDGNYEPSNCRWVDMKTQQNNRSTNHLITYKNKTLTLNQWSKILNINAPTIRYRLKHNWSVEKAFNYIDI